MKERLRHKEEENKQVSDFGTRDVFINLAAVRRSCSALGLSFFHFVGFQMQTSARPSSDKDLESRKLIVLFTFTM